MARQIRVILTDDLDGSEGAQTVEFALAGQAYSIDLSEANTRKLEEALAPFIEKAERVGGRGRARKAAPRSSSSRSSSNTAAIREWAKANGFQVSDRGRIPADVVAAYEAAN